MSKFTLYRADIDSPRLARILGKVPGVAVEGGQEGDGLRERMPAPDTDIGAEEKSSVVKTYGLLGLGVSMVALGIATVGIWVYRRRTGGDGESETPPPSTGLDSDEPAVAGLDTDEPTPTAAETELSVGESEPSDLSIEQPGEPADDGVGEEPGPRGRTEGDRTDVEWAPRDTTPTNEPETVSEPAERAEPGITDEDDARPAESVDAAPLLGAAFLALSGVVVKWLQSGDET